MDGQTLSESLTDDLETELSRLGSSKWLYALTDGEMTATAVRAAAAADAAAATDRFETWAADADDPAVETLFSALAADAAERRSAADVDSTPATPDRRVHAVLADLDATAARVGGALGYTLVLDRTVGQMVGFFVGDADPRTADRFRSLRDDVDDAEARLAGALDDVCASDDDWSSARSAAVAVVEAAYDDYVGTLESMGVEPKNVC